MAVRVNAAGTDIAFAHRVTGRNDDGVTIRYLEGPKAGLEVHFFGEAELRGLFATGFEPVLPPRAQVTWRQPRGRPVDPVGRHLACDRLTGRPRSG